MDYRVADNRFCNGVRVELKHFSLVVPMDIGTIDLDQLKSVRVTWNKKSGTSKEPAVFFLR